MIDRAQLEFDTKEFIKSIERAALAIEGDIERLIRAREKIIPFLRAEATGATKVRLPRHTMPAIAIADVYEAWQCVEMTSDCLVFEPFDGA